MMTCATTITSKFRGYPVRHSCKHTAGQGPQQAYCHQHAKDERFYQQEHRLTARQRLGL